MNTGSGQPQGAGAPLRNNHGCDDVFLNVDDAVERMGEKDIYLEIARFFANNLPSSLSALLNALEEDKAEDATRYAHSLKGNCATVGADELRETCLRLEKTCRAGDMTEARRIYDTLAPQLLVLRDKLLAL